MQDSKYFTLLNHCGFVTQLEEHSNTVYLIMLISVWACQDLLFQSIVSVVGLVTRGQQIVGITVTSRTSRSDKQA